MIPTPLTSLFLLISVITLVVPINSQKEENQENEVITVEFRLFANQDPVNYKTISPTNLDGFHFSSKLNYIVLCHGWTNTIDTSEFYIAVVAAFMKHPNFVVILAGYGDYVANPIYFPILKYVSPIGTIVGSLIEAIYTHKKVPIDKFEVMGHSLGAHIGAVAGKYVKTKTRHLVRRLFGLDPAFPGFEDPESGITKAASKRVVIFHTSELGIHDSRGHLDFWPFGGVTQGNCGLQHNGDHSVSWWYMACSICGDCSVFTGYQHSGYAEYLLDFGGTPSASAWMGYGVKDEASDGDYYLSPDCSKVIDKNDNDNKKKSKNKNCK